MPLSSVLGASTLIKPGVVTSSTRPAVPYEGQLIFETDTDRIAAYNGSAWVTQNGLQLIKTQTIGSAVSTVVVSDVFSSAYENYKIVISGGLASNSGYCFLYLGTGAAPSTGYYRNSIFQDYGSGTVQGGNTSNGGNFGAAFQASGNAIQADITIYGPNLAKLTTLTAHSARAASPGSIAFTAGFVNDSTQYTGFTIGPDAGTLTGGTIRVYGYANN